MAPVTRAGAMWAAFNGGLVNHLSTDHAPAGRDHKATHSVWNAQAALGPFHKFTPPARLRSDEPPGTGSSISTSSTCLRLPDLEARRRGAPGLWNPRHKGGQLREELSLAIL
jgi:hypothetical protein